jgi:hypothetical protein
MNKALDKNMSIGYRGDVKISTYIGDYLISTKTYRNKGTLPLFRFLANCLAGNFPAAYHLRPYKLKLLKIDNSVDNPENVKLPGDLLKTPENQVECTDFINLAAAPEISFTDNENGSSCKVKFSYIFPYARLRRSGANMVAIYGPGIEDFTEYCAYYLLTRQTFDANGDAKLEWDPIQLPEDEDELNKIFAVEWVMTLSNQAK